MDEGLNRKIGMEEVERALRSMKNKKAAGEDGIGAEFLKYLPRVWIVELTGFFNEIFAGTVMIKGWRMVRIFPIHKGGDEEEVKNYRGVSLIDSGYKL